jgi:oxygen-independent coproporphyrinogen III oxidase
LYELGKDMLVSLGYKDIGMDHFALPYDALYRAAENNSLHRNFMGYTVCNTDLLIGLGTSAISDAKYGYMQNKKVVEHYKESILLNDSLAIFKSHKMTETDLLIRKQILKLLCQGNINLEDGLIGILSMKSKYQLIIMEEEGLLTISKGILKVTELGKAFIRNIAMELDLKLKEDQKVPEQIFSKAI